MAEEEPGETIWGGPTKRFFVSMLTRDIELKDAILDLIDNCVDGATRQLKGKLKGEKPYEGYWARLSLSAEGFEIADNCGGIPESSIKDAFLLGRPKLDHKIPTIGMYGIGMKRAIFKIGEEAFVQSFSIDGAFEVEYTRDWLDPENDEWDLPISEVANKKTKGLTILIPSLRKEVAKKFGNSSFENDLKTAVSEHFGYLIQRGFVVYVNDEKLRSRTLHLHGLDGQQEGIRPFDFEAVRDGVHVRVTVGFFRPLTKMEEVDEEAERPVEKREAGISVICNDRLVLLNDVSMKTGWGDGGVARYHPQFRGIAGFIIFSTDNPEKLPISTTKRDLDVGEEIFLFARQYCIEGLKECIAFTNKWKGMEEETEKFFSAAKLKDARTEIHLAAKHGIPLRGGGGKKLNASLPVPAQRNPMRRISFARKEDAIKTVSVHLFGEDVDSPKQVGEECFDRMLKTAKKEGR